MGLAEMRIQMARNVGGDVPSVEECIRQYLPANLQQDSHPVPAGVHEDIQYEPTTNRHQLEFVNTLLIGRVVVGDSTHTYNVTEAYLPVKRYLLAGA